MNYGGAYLETLGPESEENKRIYARRHGYDLIANTKVIDPERRHSWGKVRERGRR